MTACEKQFLGHRRYGDERGGVDHALGVLAGPKDGEAVFGGAEGFDAFVRLLAIVQARGHAVNGEVWGADEGW